MLGCIESESPMDTQAVKALLQRGAAADTWSPSGLSALMLAASLGKLQIMKLLMEEEAREGTCKCTEATPNVADVKLADGQQWTPLMHAASADRVDAVRLLLKFGSEVSGPFHVHSGSKHRILLHVCWGTQAGCIGICIGSLQCRLGSFRHLLCPC
jgi:ankyrin repeat protein